MFDAITNGIALGYQYPSGKRASKTTPISAKQPSATWYPLYYHGRCPATPSNAAFIANHGSTAGLKSLQDIISHRIGVDKLRAYDCSL
jgi:hypothetical protein